MQRTDHAVIPDTPSKLGFVSLDGRKYDIELTENGRYWICGKKFRNWEQAIAFAKSNHKDENPSYTPSDDMYVYYGTS